MNESKIKHLNSGRKSESWIALKPLAEEDLVQHIMRMKIRFDFPSDVFAQWLHPHYDNADTIKNYSWLDFDRILFEEVYLRQNQFDKLHVISTYLPYVTTKSACTPFDDFTCNNSDRQYWIESGTWRVPPIVLDVSTLHNIPNYADISGAFQLVEGHTRLGYLLAMQRTRKISEVNQHRVYRMFYS